MSGTNHTAAPLAELLADAGLDTVEGAFAYAGEGDMTVCGLGHRQRWRLELTDRAGRRRVVYMKRYDREPLRWRIGRWVRHGLGRSPAAIERDNILAAQAAGVPTIAEAFAADQRGRGGVRRSYVVLSAVPGEALEQCIEGLLAGWGMESGEAEAFTRDLALLVRRFHRAGYVHRDLYTSHVFLDNSPHGGAGLYLIDLARMFAPRVRGFRWRVKDLAQLKFSMPAGWVSRHWDSFMEQYFQGQPPRVRARYERAVDRKAAIIAGHEQHRIKRKSR